MILQGYLVICNGIHYNGRHLKPMCKRCSLYSRVKQPSKSSWRISGIDKCIINHVVGTTNLNTTLNLTYVLTDVVETLLYDLRSEMGKQGYELRHDAKRNFNTAIASIRKLKQDVDKTQFSTQENFGNDSDCLLAFIRLLVDRCGDDDKKMFEFYNYIKRFPSQLGLELADEKSVFAHIFDN